MRLSFWSTQGNSLSPHQFGREHGFIPDASGTIHTELAVFPSFSIDSPSLFHDHIQDVVDDVKVGIVIVWNGEQGIDRLRKERDVSFGVFQDVR